MTDKDVCEEIEIFLSNKFNIELTVEEYRELRTIISTFEDEIKADIREQVFELAENIRG